MNELATSADLEFAKRLADTADRISRERFRASDLIVTQKPDLSQVTDADKAVETAIRELIAEHRPADSIYGEEFGTTMGTTTGTTTGTTIGTTTGTSVSTTPGTATGTTASTTSDGITNNSPRQWIIDPIDGTANYVRGVPVWATLIALAVDGIPVLGVVSAPALGRRWWGANGLGAHTRELDGTEHSIHVSQVTKLKNASIACSGLDRFEKAGRLPQYLELVRTSWRNRDYGDAWPYMMVAEGLVDVAGEFGLQTYDMAALVPIVQEAGGTFTSMDGEPGPWHGSALATNGLLHDATLNALAAR